MLAAVDNWRRPPSLPPGGLARSPRPGDVAVGVGVVTVGLGVVAVGLGVVAVGVGVGVGVALPQLARNKPSNIITVSVMNANFFIILAFFLLLIIGKTVINSLFRYYHLLPTEQLLNIARC
jgi:hypothetical protein